MEVNKEEIPRFEKKLGDGKISEKNYESAILHYKNAIVALKLLFDNEEFAKDETKATKLIEEVGIPVHLNLAFCYLQIEDWTNVVFYCSKVLELKPGHVKALYRRCKAYLKLHNLESARKDIEELEVSLPKSEEVNHLKNELKLIENNDRENAFQNLVKEFGNKNLLNNPHDTLRDEFNKIKTTKFQDFVSKLTNTGSYLFNLWVEIGFKLPLNLAYKTTKGVKTVFWDTPLDITSKLAQSIIISPTKWFLSKVYPFK